MAWADSELYHLGPVVAAQQIHQVPMLLWRLVHMLIVVHNVAKNHKKPKTKVHCLLLRFISAPYGTEVIPFLCYLTAGL